MNSALVDKDLEAQRRYAAKQADTFDYNLVVADAFIRGIRDLGYRNSARAIDEIIDNSIQAGADTIVIAFGYGPDSNEKPTDLAIVDNGHGMHPEMLRMSVIWGGTHRENDRTGFGRYGWGLPSSTVSMGRRYKVYSKVAEGALHSVGVNLDAIAGGDIDTDGKIIIDPAVLDEMPDWLQEHVDKHMPTFSNGTAIAVSSLDKLSWKTRTALERNLLQSIGLIYRNFLRDVTIIVNGKRVEPIDPLFTTPGCRFYELDEDRAEPLAPLEFDVKDPETRKVQGHVRVRFSSIPATFARVDKMASPRARNNNNARLPILSDNNGLIVLREGRQIDVVTQRGYLTVNNDDRYWGCEVDIPATLDEEMSITTSKQQVVLSDRMWKLLEQHGVLAAIRELRGRYDNETTQLKVKRERAQEEDELRRASEQAMMDSEKFTTRKPVDTQRKRERSKQALEKEIKRRSEESGVPTKAIEAQILSDAQENPFRVKEEEMTGAPFYRVQQLGGQRWLFLNTAHCFYNDVYAGPGSTARSRAALEILLFAIGAAELSASDERQTFYEMERSAWSDRLSAALQALEELDSARDARVAETDAVERENEGA